MQFLLTCLEYPVGLFSFRFWKSLQNGDAMKLEAGDLLIYLVGLGQHFQDLGHSFSPYGPSSQQITYKDIYSMWLLIYACVD